MSKIVCLQIGVRDFSTIYRVPDCVHYIYTPALTTDVKGPFDLVIVDKEPTAAENVLLRKWAKTHTLFITERVQPTGNFLSLYRTKLGRCIPDNMIREFIEEETRYFFYRSSDVKFTPRKLSVSSAFKGTTRTDGDYRAVLSGHFGMEYSQIAYWCDNIVVEAGQTVELWLEYEYDTDVSFVLVVISHSRESGALNGRFEFDREVMKNPIRIKAGEDSTFFCAVYAKGYGTLRIGSLHHRRSRGAQGYLLPGGERRVTTKREEIFSYFEPGNGGAPLVVYFCDFDVHEWFEGAVMLRQLGAPFLILKDTRLDGGAFFLGDAEYERVVLDIIGDTMKRLGITGENLLMCGISMGAYGALYYGGKLGAGHVVIGKPLANPGDVATMSKHFRPRGFEAAMDIVAYLQQEVDEEARTKLNNRLWDILYTVDLSQVKYSIAYMREDDYDPYGFDDILDCLDDAGASVVSKAFHGRHEDAERDVRQWFAEELQLVLQEVFGRIRR